MDSLCEEWLKPFVETNGVAFAENLLHFMPIPEDQRARFRVVVSVVSDGVDAMHRTWDEYLEDADVVLMYFPPCQRSIDGYVYLCA